MPFLLTLLTFGVFVYFAWRWRKNGVTRACRWRQQRAEGVWRCAACGAEQSGSLKPNRCAGRSV
ncbi:hypothetical protein CFI11_20770 [Thalassococcus sp. S3]|nr:hypothetical protein CFI11_20770 [Thalassococcus sp. S3]